MKKRSSFRAGVPALHRLMRRSRDVGPEVEAELELHLDLTTEELMAEGMTPAAARAEAERRFGDLDSREQQCTTLGRQQLREQRRTWYLDEFRQDIAYALRSLARQPMFALLAVLTLALGIGATTTIFSIVDAVVLRPLPYPEPDRLVAVGSIPSYRDTIGPMSPLNLFDFQEQNSVFERLAGSRGTTAALQHGDSAENVSGAAVSGGFFELLGTPPLLGRTLTIEDDRTDATPVTVLGFGLWQGRFGGSADVLGRQVRLSGTSFTVVGVMPDSFRPPEALYQGDALLWFPLAHVGDDLSTRRDSFLQAIGRLKPGVGIEQARANMSGIAAALAEQYPDVNLLDGKPIGVGLEPLYRETVGAIAPTLGMLLGAVGLLLLISCSNVASLVLARSTARERELAIRSAVGAGRRRILRQLLTENLVLGLLGGAVGVAIAYGGVELFRLFNPGDIPRAGEVTVDARILLFVLGLSALTGLLSGLLPAFHVSGRDVNERLKEGAGGPDGGRRRQRLLRTLVFAEIGLATVLLVSAGLLINSFVRLQHVEKGFVTDNRMMMRVYVGQGTGYDEDVDQIRFFSDVIARIGAVPGVRAVAATHTLPLDGNRAGTQIAIAGAPSPDGKGHPALYHQVTPNYFRTMGIRLEQGREFTESDDPDGPRVVVIDRAMASLHWPGEDALGKQFKFGGDDSEGSWYTVIGVAGNVRQASLAEGSSGELYLPFLRFPRPSMKIVVHGAIDPAALAPAMRRAVADVAPEIPATGLMSLDEHVADSLAGPRFYMLLLTVFAGVAGMLAVVGVYGTMSFTVGSRKRDLGIRIAMGATSRQVFGHVIRNGLETAIAGLVFGLFGAWGVTRLLQSFLYAIRATDPWTFLAVAVLLASAALLACLVPALRATSVDPLLTLRSD